MAKKNDRNQEEHFFLASDFEDDFPQDLVDEFRSDKTGDSEDLVEEFRTDRSAQKADKPAPAPAPAPEQASSDRQPAEKAAADEKQDAADAEEDAEERRRREQEERRLREQEKRDEERRRREQAKREKKEKRERDRQRREQAKQAASAPAPTTQGTQPQAAKPQEAKPQEAKPQGTQSQEAQPQEAQPQGTQSQVPAEEQGEQYDSLQDELNAVLTKWQAQAGGKPLTVTVGHNHKEKPKKEKKPRVHRGFKGTIKHIIETVVPVIGDNPIAVVRKVIIVVSMVVLIGTLTYIFDETVLIPANNRVIAEQQREQYTPGSNPELTPDEEAFQYPEGIDPSFKKLYYQNPDVRGWVTYRANGGDDFLDIDYPIMQTDNNEFYLTHDFHLTYNKNGALFFDYRNDFSGANYKNRNEIIYGHNMASGQMFGRLNNMLYGVNYAQCAPTFTLNTIYRSGIYKVFAVMVVNTQPEDGTPFQYLQTEFRTDAEFANFLSEIKARSLYTYNNLDLMATDEIVTLSTCNSYSDVYMNDARTVVVGRRLRDGESVDTDINLITDNPNVIMPYAWYINQGRNPHEYYTNPNYRIELIPGAVYIPTTRPTITTTTSAPKYTLTVAGGSSSGSYAPGSIITVTAEALPNGSRFKAWIATGLNGVDLTQSTLTFTMPANPVTLIASAESAYTVSVFGGTGGGSYAPGSLVTVTATDIPSGYVFAGWLVTGATVSSPSAQTTTFVMPAGNVELIATYGNQPQPTQPQYLFVTVNGGSSSGYYAVGSSVTVNADAAPEGYYFDGWDSPRLAERGYDLSSASLTFTMPEVPVYLTAKFTPYPTTTTPAPTTTTTAAVIS